MRAYFHTYGLPVLTTNCSNNYGPFQFPEKLIPLMILNALEGKPLPVYGDGQNVRDWLFVDDHCAAIRTVLEQRQARRDLQHRRQQRAQQSRRRATRSAISSTRCGPTQRIGSRRKLITFRRRTARATTAATRSTRARSRASSAGARVELRKRAAQDRALVSRTRIAWVENVRSGAYCTWIEQNYEERIAQ